MRGSFIALTTATVLAMPAAPLAAQPPWAQPRFVPRAQPAALSPVYRLVADGSNDHVYSIDANEVNVLAQQGSHTYEGVVFQLFSTPRPGLQPLYRYVTGNGTHLIDTQRPARADRSARLEGALGYVAGPGPGLVPLHMWVNPRHGLSFYTTHAQGEFAAHNGYVYQGALGYVAPGG